MAFEPAGRDARRHRLRQRSLRSDLDHPYGVATAEGRQVTTESTRVDRVREGGRLRAGARVSEDGPRDRGRRGRAAPLVHSEREPGARDRTPDPRPAPESGGPEFLASEA
ncbi:hypothetical protein [Actinoplanes sp. NPDC049681]|uniref:hypothetical protein n=1 Tax=Actinoplanes sp. NPDC049681 TaxID=3363905 RepID=UPI00378C6569